MRSLKLISAVCYDQFTDLVTSARCMTVDCDTGTVYFSTNTDIVAINPELNETVSNVSLQEFMNDDNDVVAMQHLPDEMSICVALSNGDILMYHYSTDSVECVGSVASGVLAMAYSPDQELIVLVTGDHQITLMNREFDPIVETDLHVDDFGEAKFVNVGWGKKETQFHGSEGKNAAKQKVEDIEPVGEEDDGKVRVSWRGDGQYFAVSCVHRSKGCRVIRMWTREGVHHSTSELVSGLEHSLDWKPTGSLIASTQRLANKHIVRFFERNGLMHGEFTLPLSGHVREVKWNKDSSVLCVWMEGEKENVLQLWTVNNYHWYLKQSITHADRIGGFCWDPEHDYRLHYWLKDGRYFMYEWAWHTFISNAYNGEYLASVMVIDGCEVLVTPFRMAVVPPPMCGYKLLSPRPVSEVTCSPSSNQIVVLTVNHDVIVHNVRKECGGKSVKEDRIYRVELPDKLQPLCQLHHSTLIDDEHLLLASQNPGRKSNLYLMKISDSGLELVKSYDVEGSIVAISATSGDIVAVELDTGRILKFDLETGLSPWLDSQQREVSFPQPCDRMEICTFIHEMALLGLTDRYRFYVNSLEVASNCTSFFVHDKFVLLTTLSHTIRCIPRCTGLTDLVKLADDKAHPFDECVRRVERGSRIVTAVSQSTSVILQMPRGNLETIHPRALVLESVRDNLDHSRYDAAFMLMKKHRINMNLIHDHNPEKFLDDSEVFVRQIGKADHVNLFLAELQESDVTVTMYDAAYKARKNAKRDECGKVDKICDRMLNTLTKVDESKFFLSILTCYVKKRRPDLETALFKIAEAKDGKIRVSVDEALKYLLYLVDVNELYDVALGTYDFSLVLMVAEKSQKDPKEYLPLLNQLKSMEENYRKFTIDKLLKRYSSSLTHVVKCEGKFDECVDLVKGHSLYTEALLLFKAGSEEYRRIAKAQGDFLSEKRYYEEAGLAYWRAEAWDEAVDVFTKALCWRECMCMAQNAKYDATKKKDLVLELSARLKNACRISEAGQIVEVYLGDHEEAIVTLIDGELWSEAMSLIYRCGRLDFIETNLKPKVLESFEHHSSELPELRRQFHGYYDRLVEVRNEKERRHFELISDPAYNDAEADLYSDMSSVSGESVTSRRTQSSFFSTASSRTNRSRRKNEKKKFSLKPGSANEDLALVDALQKVIGQVEQLKTEIGALLKVLVLFDRTREAMTLQESLIEFLDVIKKAIPVVWLEEEVEDLVTDAQMNSTALAAQQRREMMKTELNKHTQLRNPPVLKASQEWKLRTLKTDR